MGGSGGRGRKSESGGDSRVFRGVDDRDAEERVDAYIGVDYGQGQWGGGGAI